MLRNFFKPLKHKDYNIQVLKDSTSQAAVKRVKRTRFAAPFKAAASFVLMAVMLGGGLATTASAVTVTASHANADIISQLVCIDGNSQDAGKWNSGSNRFANMGGRSAFSMEKISSSTIANNVAVFGIPGTTWADAAGGQYDGGRFVTAYEKYGMSYPQFDAWLPLFADKTYTFKGAATTGNPPTYNNGGSIPTSSLGTKTLEPGESRLTTTNALSCLGTLPAIEAGVANIISMPARFITAVALELYGASYGTSISQEGSVLYPIGQAIDGIITEPGGLRDTLFVPFIIPLILIGAMWVAWIGIIKRAATAALQSVVWMVAAIAAGTFFLAQPTLISGGIDYGVAQIQTAINEVVLAGGDANDMCNLNSSGDTNKVTREVKCTIWYSTIYAPWVSGQFGESANAAVSADPNRSGSPIMKNDPRSFLSNARIQYGDGQSVAPATWPQLMVDRQATNQSFDISEVAYAQLSGDGMAINNVWAGGTLNQISASILMFFGTIASTLVLFVYGFMLLIYQLMMIVAVLLSPLFFLFGIVPNWGRRVLMRYAELLVSVGVKRIITSLLLAIYLLFYQMITGAGPLFLQLILVLALAIFALVARGRFVNLFTQGINFGGNKSIGLPGAKAAGTVAGIGAGALAAVGGGLIVGALAGRATRKAVQGENQDLAHDPNKVVLAGGGGAPVADVRRTPEQRRGNPIDTVNRNVERVEDTRQTISAAQSALGGGSTGAGAGASASGAGASASGAGAVGAGAAASGGAAAAGTVAAGAGAVGVAGAAAAGAAGNGSRQRNNGGNASGGTGRGNYSLPNNTPSSGGAPVGGRVSGPQQNNPEQNESSSPNAGWTADKSSASNGTGRVAPARSAAGAPPFPSGGGVGSAGAGSAGSGAAATGGSSAAAGSAAGVAGGAGAVGGAGASGAAVAAVKGGSVAAGSAAGGGAAAAGGGAAAAGGAGAAAGAAGAGAGVAGGAATGAAAGSVVPVAGTIAGAAVGAVAASAAAKRVQAKRNEEDDSR